MILSRQSLRQVLVSRASQILRRPSDAPFSGCIENFRSKMHSEPLGNFGPKLGLVKVKENINPPYALCLQSYIHSGKPMENEPGSPASSMNFIKGIMLENRNDETLRSYRYQPPDRYPPAAGQQVEKNADIVHIKLMRNNTFITVTDSEGNKKAGVSAGTLAVKGAKVARYSGEAAAEHIGRKIKEMGLKSVVVKVNGFTYFRKKKLAVLSLRDGYSNSRRDINPVVYIEDTTRKPHNGCRLPKKRRI